MTDSKKTSIVTEAVEKVGLIGTAMSHIHTGLAAFGLDIFGGNPKGTAESNITAKERAEGSYGFLGFGDERQLQRIMNSFLMSYGKTKTGKPRKAGKDAVKAVEKFLVTYYKIEGDFWSCQRGRNGLSNFREILAKMDSTTLTKTGTVKTTATAENPNAGVKIVSESNQDVYPDNLPDSVQFLRRLAAALLEAEDEDAGREAAVTILKAGGFPTMPENGEIDKFDVARNVVGTNPNTALQSASDHYRSKRRGPFGFLARWL